MKRKVLSLVLAIMLISTTIFSVNTTVVCADSGSCGSNATFKYDTATKTLTISGTGAIKDYTAVAISRAPWYERRSTCTKVVINEGITTIGSRAFYLMTALTEVSLPSTLTKINNNAFSECSALTSIRLPNNLETIEYAAFKKTALTSITFPDSLKAINGIADNGAFSECANLKTVIYGSGMTSTGKYAFQNSGVNSVSFGDNISAIDSYSFYGTQLLTISLPEKIASIGTRSFANCYYLSTVYIYNKDCKFEGVQLGSSGEDPFNNGAQQMITFYGHSKSTTQTYAESKGYKFVSIDPCLHENISENVLEEPDCETEGTMNVVCNDCGETIDSYKIAATGHSFETAETSDMTEIDGHTYEYQVCSVCGKENSAPTHIVFVEGCYTVTTTATCTIPGIATKTCDICGKQERSAASRLEHNIENPTSSVSPTCTQSGSKTGLCTICNKEVTQNTPALGHKENLVSSETLNNGHTVNNYSCGVCGEPRSETVHNEWIEGLYTTDVVSAATCTSRGRIEKVCTVCNKIETEAIEMTGHNYDEGVVTKQPSCSASGTTTYTCLNCQNTYNLPIRSLGHDYSIDTVLKEPTCETVGTGSKQCSRCTSATSYTIPAFGHDIEESEDFEIIAQPSCTEKGKVKGTCQTCGNVVELDTDAAGHSYDTENPVVVTAPTCTKSGNGIASCTVCGAESEITLPAHGHHYAYSGPGTNSLGVTLVYTCSICDNANSVNKAVVTAAFINFLNKKTAETATGYMYDVNFDGVINIRDYTIIYSAGL